MTVSVVIVTMNRPEHVKTCLRHLREQTRLPEEIILVDASKDGRTREVVESFDGVLYLHNPAGYGHMTMSRNMGLVRSSGDIVAFIDDDAYADPTWLEELVASYEEDERGEVGAIGGRAKQGDRPPEPWVEVDKIGKLMPNGELYAGFDTDSGRVQDVDHMIGCNMSFRRETLAQLGGFRDDFPGTEVCEESDICLRVRRIGKRILYNPKALVVHMGAPHFKGRRFDARYNYYSARNNCLLLIRNYGLFSMIFVRFLLRMTRDRMRDLVKEMGSSVYRIGAYMVGLCTGICVGVAKRVTQGKSPILNDAGGNARRAALRKTAERDAVHS